jgi:hypothetical protein
MPACQLQPYQQGHLDGLCGIYSVLNAVRFALQTAELRRSGSSRARRLRHEECELLFTTLVSAIGQRHRHARFVFDGLSPLQLGSLLRSADKWLRMYRGLALTSTRPLERGVRKTALLARISSHLCGPGSAAIVGAKAPWPHWTVATRVTKARVYLLDSEGDTSISIRRGRRRLRYHAGLIDPSCLYLVQLKDLPKAR